MNPCVWFLVLQEFGALQTSLLKHNRRLKQSDSLPLNAARGAGGSEVWSRGKAPVGVWGTKSPEAEAFGTFAHNILHLPYARFFTGQRGGHGPSGPVVNTPVTPPQSSLFPGLSPSFFFPGKQRVWGPPGKFFEILDCCR